MPGQQAPLFCPGPSSLLGQCGFPARACLREQRDDLLVAGLAEIPIVRRLMAMVQGGRVDTGALVTHHLSLDQIEKAYDLFTNQHDGVLKVAIRP